MLAFAMGFAAAGAASGRDRVVSVVRADAHSGRLVRTVVKSAAPAARPANESKPVGAISAKSAPSAIAETVDRIAAQHELPPQLIHSVIQVESNYNPWAVSPKGAFGLMQLIPATARRFGVSDIFNPEDNIQGGAKYLKYLLGLYGGNYTLALAAYNAGEAAVARYGAVPPYSETINYVKQVGARLAVSPAPAAETTAPPKFFDAATLSIQGPAPEPAPARIQEIVEPGGGVRYVSR